MRKILIAACLLFSFSSVYGIVEIPNQVDVQLKADVTYDPGTGLYTYTYTATSTIASIQEVSDIYITLNGSSAINIKSPQGWNADVTLDGDTLIWCACEEYGIIAPPGYVDDGNVVPSIYQIKPGKNLTGFSFQSPDPPDLGIFYAEGFARIPVEGVDFPAGQDPDVPTWPNDLFKGQTKVPKYTEKLFLGGRRGAVDGFLVFKNIANRDTKIAPVQVDIEFGFNGETVDQSTFNAYLNSQDVTAQFKSTGPKTMRAVFQPSQLNIGGRNTLLTTVQGILPSNGRAAGDVDRVTFTVQP